jgi:hypothetical protein
LRKIAAWQIMRCQIITFVKVYQQKILRRGMKKRLSEAVAQDFSSLLTRVGNDATEKV